MQTKTTDPDSWPADRLAQDVAFTISPAGRLRREDREVAFAIEIGRLQTAINEAYRIMCSGTPPHSARETNARRVLRLAGVTVKDQAV